MEQIQLVREDTCAAERAQSGPRLAKYSQSVYLFAAINKRVQQTVLDKLLLNNHLLEFKQNFLYEVKCLDCLGENVSVSWSNIAFRAAAAV